MFIKKLISSCIILLTFEQRGGVLLFWGACAIINPYNMRWTRTKFYCIAVLRLLQQKVNNYKWIWKHLYVYRSPHISCTYNYEISLNWIVQRSNEIVLGMRLNNKWNKTEFLDSRVSVILVHYLLESSKNWGTRPVKHWV